MSIYFNVIERAIGMRHWTVMLLSISMSRRRRNLGHCGEQGMQSRRHGKKVQEDVHVIPRSTLFILITKNEFQLLFLFSEVQRCLVDPLGSLAYAGGSPAGQSEQLAQGGLQLSYLWGSAERRPAEAAGGRNGVLLHLGQTLHSIRE